MVVQSLYSLFFEFLIRVKIKREKRKWRITCMRTLETNQIQMTDKVLASVKLAPSFLPPSVCRSTKSTHQSLSFGRMGLVTVTRCKLRYFSVKEARKGFLLLQCL